MEIFLALGIFLVSVALLSLGTLVFRRPIKGSCGGVANAMGKSGGSCDACGRSYDDCPEREKAGA